MRILSHRWFQLGLRLLLGGVFIYAGTLKILSPQPFADSIATYRLLPGPLIDLLALGLPAFEVAVGSLLVVGLYVRAAALGVLLMTGVFALALASVLARGLRLLWQRGYLGGTGLGFPRTGYSTRGIGVAALFARET